MGAPKFRRSRVVGTLNMLCPPTYLDSSFIQCISEDNYLVAHYDLRQPHMPAYGVSGNTLTVHESFCHLSIGRLQLSILGQ
jgi:hypothetical protein